jgi:hypothetical protein
MLFLVLFFVVLLLWLIANHLHVKAVQRTNRLLRRVPCVTCGCPLLPAARACPNCHSSQPLRGWAGWGWADIWPVLAVAMVACLAVGFALIMAAGGPALQPAPQHVTAPPQSPPAPAAAAGTHTASGVTYHDRAAPPPTPSASQPLNRMDRCVAMLGAQDVANGHVGGYGAAVERRKWCEANWGSGK